MRRDKQGARHLQAQVSAHGRGRRETSQTPTANAERRKGAPLHVGRQDDNTYALSIDGKEEKTGSLFEDFEPPFNPPKEIDDPEDKKPEDWVDDAKMADPAAKKPDDWDEDAAASIPDEDAVKPDDWLDDEPMEVEDDEAVIPEDWDVEEDGDWQPPMIPNPACAEVSGCGEWVRPEKSNPEYKGKWYPPMIDNPAYKGEWKPKQIPNPKYYEDKTPLANIGKIGAVGVEIWTMSSGLVIDNIAVDADIDAVKAFGESFEEKDKSVNTVVEARAEEARKKAESEQDSFNTAGPLGHAQLSALAARLPGLRRRLRPSPRWSTLSPTRWCTTSPSSLSRSSLPCSPSSPSSARAPNKRRRRHNKPRTPRRRRMTTSTKTKTTTTRTNLPRRRRRRRPRASAAFADLRKHH